MAKGKKKESLTPEERLQAALVPEIEQPYKVPGNWRWTFLKPISKIRTGKKDANYGSIDGEYPFFTCAAEPIRCHGYSFDCNAILLAGNGDINNISRYNGKFEAYQRTYVVEIIEPINIDYVFYWFKYRWFDFNKDKMFGTAIPYIRLGNLQEFPIPVPPLAQQQRIVNRIESLFAKLDEVKQKAQDALDSFETRKAAILHKAFTGELIGKHSTATTTLEEITTCIRIGPFGSALHKEDYILGGVPVVNPKHIVQQKIVPEEKTTVSVLKAEELSSYILQKNDIILGRRGDMGRSAPVTDLETGWLCGTGSMIIRLKSGYNAKFYSQIIASQAAVRYLEENSVGSTMKNLNEKVVRLLPIPDFTVDEQLEIVRILDNLLAKEQQAKEVAEKVLKQIDLIKKAILARAFRGELGTNDPSEENAVELLKVIV